MYNQFLKTSNIFGTYLVLFLFLFFETFLCVALIVYRPINSLYRSCWPQTQNFTCLCLLSVGIKASATTVQENIPFPNFCSIFTCKNYLPKYLNLLWTNIYWVYYLYTILDSPIFPFLDINCAIDEFSCLLVC